MKILLVNEGSLGRAGICLFLFQWTKILAEILPDSTITVYFRLGVGDTALEKEFRKNGIRLVIGNHDPNGTSADKKNREAVKKDLREILKEDYDIVHINSSVLGFTSLVLAEAKRAKVPVRISHGHGEFYAGRLKKIIHELLRIYIRKTATLYVGCSSNAIRYMFGQRILDSKKWIIIPNAIQTDRFAYNEKARQLRRNELGLEEGQLLLGAVGYLEDMKNHTFLIDVMAQLKAKNIMPKLIIFGIGSLKDRLCSKIRALGLENDIIMYGKTDDVASWLSAMDWFLMPSLLGEGFPISSIEAQTSGLKCILSTNITTEVDITDGVTHLPVDHGPDKWAEKIAGEKPNPLQKRINARTVVEEAGYGIKSLEAAIRKLYGI